MAERAHKRCAKFMCPGRVMPPVRFCPAHADREQPAWQRVDEHRGSSSERGYDHIWRRCREITLTRDCHTCQHCLKRGDVRPATDVHHIRPLTTHPELRLVLDNLISLCHRCNQQADAERRARGE